MKKWFKRGLFAIVALFIVTIVGAAVFLLTFDPNAYKERVEQLVYERYQRTLKINGEIELSLFPRIGLSVADVALSDRQSTQPFAAIDSARVAVAVWPLLWNHLVVDHVAVSGFKVWLARNEAGEFNFTDLLERTAPQAAQSTSTTSIVSTLVPIAAAQAESEVLSAHIESTVFEIDIAGLELKDGAIHFFDSGSQTQMDLVNLDINTGRMTFDQPFDVIFKGRLQGDKPKTDATLTGQMLLELAPQRNRYTAQRINMSLEGAIDPYPAFAVNKANISLTAAQISLVRHLESLQASKLKVRAQGLLDLAHEHKVELSLDVPQLTLTLEQVQSEPVAFSYKQSQGANLFGLNARIQALSGHLSQLQLAQIQADIVGKNSRAAWRLEGSAVAQAQLQESAFNVQWYDLNARLRLEDGALNPSSAQATIIGGGQWQSAAQQLQLGLSVETKDTDVWPWLNSAASKALFLPGYINWSQVQLELALQARALQLANYHLEDLSVNATQTDGLFSFNSLRSPLFNGELEATGSWQVEPVQSQGQTAAAWWAGLTGSVDVEAEQGQVLGWDLWQPLQAVESDPELKVGAESMPFDGAVATTFEQLALRLELEQGRVQLTQLDVIAAEGALQPQPPAYIDLINKQMQLGFQAYRPTNTDEEAAAPLFIRLSGLWQAPVLIWHH